MSACLGKSLLNYANLYYSQRQTACVRGSLVIYTNIFFKYFSELAHTLLRISISCLWIFIYILHVKLKLYARHYFDLFPREIFCLFHRRDANASRNRQNCDWMLECCCCPLVLLPSVDVDVAFAAAAVARQHVAWKTSMAVVLQLFFRENVCLLTFMGDFSAPPNYFICCSKTTNCNVWKKTEENASISCWHRQKY